MSGGLTGRQFTRVMKDFENRRNRARMKEVRRARRLERESRRRRDPGSRRVDAGALDEMIEDVADEVDGPDEEGDPRG